MLWRSPWRVDGEGLFCNLVSVHGSFTYFYHDYVIFTCRVHSVVQTCSAWWKRDLSTTGLNQKSSAPLQRENRDLTIRQRWPPWKRRWKIDNTSFRFFSRLFQGAQLLKRREFWLEMKRRDRARVLTEMVESIAQPFPFPSKLKIWSFHVLVMQGRQRNVQNSVMHVQSCYFAHFDVPVAVTIMVSWGPNFPTCRSGACLKLLVCEKTSYSIAWENRSVHGFGWMVRKIQDR